MNIYPFDSFLHMEVFSLSGEKLSDTALVGEFLETLKKLLLGESEVSADHLYIHGTNPKLSFSMGEIISANLGILICVVPPNRKLGIYVYSSGKAELAKHRDKIKRMIHEYFAHPGTAYVKEREL